MKRSMPRIISLLMTLCLLLTLCACKKPPEAKDSAPSTVPSNDTFVPDPAGPKQMTGPAQTQYDVPETEPFQEEDEPPLAPDPAQPTDGPAPTEPEQEAPGTEPTAQPGQEPTATEPPLQPGGETPTTVPATEPGQNDPAPGDPEPEPTIVGDWATAIMLDSMLSALISEDSLGGMPMPTFPDVYVILWMDLLEDETIYMHFDEESLSDAQAEMHARLRQYLLDYFYDEYGLDEAAVEAALASQNTTLDDKVDELVKQFNLESLGQMDMQGWYSLQGGKLYVGDNPEKLRHYYVIEWEGDNLTLFDVSDEEALPAFVRILPLSFVR